MIYRVGIRVAWRYMGRVRPGTITEVIDAEHRIVRYDDGMNFYQVHIASPCLGHLNLLEAIAEAAAETDE